MSYSRYGKKYGFSIKSEIIDSIQTELEKRVTANIFRRSKKMAPVEAEIYALQNRNQENSPDVNCSRGEYDAIIKARAAAASKKSERMQQEAIEKAKHTYGAYLSSLDAYVKKAERKSDRQYRRFLLGAAKHYNSQRTSDPVRFRSQAYKEFVEKINKEGII